KNSISLVEGNNGFDFSKKTLEHHYIHQLDHMLNTKNSYSTDEIRILAELKRVNLDYSKTNNDLNAKLTSFSEILNNTPIYIYVKDNKFKYLYVNDVFVLLTNIYSREDIIGSTSSEIFGIREVKELISIEKEILFSKQNIYDRRIFIPGSNKKRIGLMNASPIINKNNEIEKIVCVIKDVTETELFLNQYFMFINAVNESEEYFFIKDIDTPKFEYISKGVELFTGIKAEYFHKDVNLWDSLIHPEDYISIGGSDRHKNEDFNYKKVIFRIKHTSEVYKWVDCKIFKRFDDYSKKYYIYGLITDITQEMKNRQLEKLLEIYVENSPIGIIIFDYESFNCLYTNTTVIDILGYSKDEFNNIGINSIIDKIVHHEDKIIFTEQFINSDNKSLIVRVIDKNKQIRKININRKFITYQGKKCRLGTITEISS
ncbi:MAG TPA: PAS domain S-box protein, partial [Victivallales bacterium]|nr:PAS domain S-box protein [Victivallales bacterium]